MQFRQLFDLSRPGEMSWTISTQQWCSIRYLIPFAIICFMNVLWYLRRSSDQRSKGKSESVQAPFRSNQRLLNWYMLLLLSTLVHPLFSVGFMSLNLWFSVYIIFVLFLLILVLSILWCAASDYSFSHSLAVLTSGAATTHYSRTPEFTLPPLLGQIHVARSLVFWVVFYRQ